MAYSTSIAMGSIKKKQFSSLLLTLPSQHRGLRAFHNKLDMKRRADLLCSISIETTVKITPQLKNLSRLKYRGGRQSRNLPVKCYRDDTE